MLGKYEEWLPASTLNYELRRWELLAARISSSFVCFFILKELLLLESGSEFVRILDMTVPFMNSGKTGQKWHDNRGERESDR